MKQKTMTKRQILTELLVIKEKEDKLAESQNRLWARQTNEVRKRKELAKKLETICTAEAKKRGDDDFNLEDPIFFKNHIFELEQGSYSDRHTTINIKEVNSVK